MEKLSTYDLAILTDRLPKKICEELDNEEWSKPYTNIDEMFKDLGLEQYIILPPSERQP